jgi:hypothetical protein
MRSVLRVAVDEPGLVAADLRDAVRRCQGACRVWVPVPDEAAAVRNAQAAGFAIDGGAHYRVAPGPH